MFELLHRGDVRELIIREGTALVFALGTAEIFFKFGSFLLETIAFLATWYVFGWLSSSIENTFRS